MLTPAHQLRLGIIFQITIWVEPQFADGQPPLHVGTVLETSVPQMVNTTRDVADITAHVLENRVDVI
jgi:hypothetical protein